MSRVNDLWLRADKNTRTARWGKGKRWQAIRTDGRGGEEKRSFDRKDAAAAWAAGTTEASAAEPMLVKEYAEQWLARQVHFRASTRKSVEYKIRKRIVPTFKGKLMASVTRGDVQDAILTWHEDLAASTVRTVYATLVAMFREAALDGVVKSSPCVKIRLPRAGEAPSKLLTVQQVQEIADGMAPWLRPAVIVASATGLRPGEWRGLTADRVNVKNGTVKVDRQLSSEGVFGPPKTDSSYRTIAVGESTVEVLRGLVKGAGDRGLLLHQADGGFVSAQVAGNAWRDMRKILPWAGAGWHSLRHAHASWLLSEGASVVAVSRRLGHKDATETLATYAHAMPQDDARMVGLTDGLVRMKRHETATNELDAK